MNLELASKLKQIERRGDTVKPQKQDAAGDRAMDTAIRCDDQAGLTGGLSDAGNPFSARR